MRTEFPYARKGQVFYPVITASLYTTRRALSVSALVDSGASFSMFRPEIAEQLDIIIEKGKPLYLEGIAGRILGYLHIVRTEAAGRRFRGKIVFSREFKVSFNLIGRDNFFQYFRIVFDEAQKKTMLEF